MTHPSILLRPINSAIQSRSRIILRILSAICFYALPIALLASLFLVPDIALYDLAVTYGEWAIGLFIFLMFAKPVTILFPWIPFAKLVIVGRKQLGIATFYLAAGHMLGLFLASNLWSQPERWLTDWTNPIFLGTAAILLLAILYLTSNKFSVRTLKRNWKRLHWIAYPALLLALMHQAGMDEGSIVPGILWFILYAVLRISAPRIKHCFNPTPTKNTR